MRMPCRMQSLPGTTGTMSYQVLARKWRPAQFTEVVGQAHIVAALSNALDQDRVHHAFLFTGTRGVGKTTLARIFAKALNCEQGVSSTPCGECSACVAVAEGRFIDLIEVDAASRTRVDDTRELLENVQYAPTQGRYKVYLIDEVHMLSTHSFNALLKTLEEPPEHVKFLLATTDPQKLPMTVLSRCIQFSLNAIEPQAIETQLSTILKSEQIDFEPAALGLLARAADGSLRDALSLLDQGIAYSNQQLSEQSVHDMLGLVDSQIIIAMLDALAIQDVDALMENVQLLIHSAQDLKTALDDLLSWLHALALHQFAPDAIEWKGLAPDSVARLSSLYPAETLQLFYQIAVNGKRDFALAPDPRTGFEMILLRLMAFKPQTDRKPAGSVPGAQLKVPAKPQQNTGTAPQLPTEEALRGLRPSVPPAAEGAEGEQYTAAPVSPELATLASEEAQPFLKNGLQNADLQRYLKPASEIKPEHVSAVVRAEEDGSEDVADASEKEVAVVDDAAVAVHDAVPQEVPTPGASIESVAAALEKPAEGEIVTDSNPQQKKFLPDEMLNISSLIDNISVWSDFVQKVGLSGMARQLVVQMTPLAYNDGILNLQLDSRYSNLQSADRNKQIGDALQQACGQKFKINVEFGDVSISQTAAGVMAERERSQLEKTRQDFNNDDNVKELVSLFDAQVDDNSIKPVN